MFSNKVAKVSIDIIAILWYPSQWLALSNWEC